MVRDKPFNIGYGQVNFVERLRFYYSKRFDQASQVLSLVFEISGVGTQ
jgi:hypothetical protein